MQAMGAKCKEQDIFPLETDEDNRLTADEKKEILSKFAPVIHRPKINTDNKPSHKLNRKVQWQP